MKLWDISRELTAAAVYPGDPAPQVTHIQQLAFGDTCNLSALSLCAHNATHLDAPLHFVPHGDDVAAVALSHCCGSCRVVCFDGVLTGDVAERIVAPGYRETLENYGKWYVAENVVELAKPFALFAIERVVPSISDNINWNPTSMSNTFTSVIN